MPPMPPTPFMPPMAPPGTSPPGASPPTDYTQQLFGYLQAWRQYLEQAIGAAPGDTAAADRFAADNDAADWFPVNGLAANWLAVIRLAVVGVHGSAKPLSCHPETLTGGSSTMTLGADSRSCSADPNSRGSRSAGPHVRFGIRREGGVRGLGSIDTTRDPITLLRSRRRHTSATGMQAGRDLRRAAPPATSKWWEAGQGLGPGFKQKPDATNLLNIRPLDLGGKQ